MRPLRTRDFELRKNKQGSLEKRIALLEAKIAILGDNLNTNKGILSKITSTLKQLVPWRSE